MNVDYRELCVELFGTDDVDQLKEIADIKEINPDYDLGGRKSLHRRMCRRSGI